MAAARPSHPTPIVVRPGGRLGLGVRTSDIEVLVDGVWRVGELGMWRVGELRMWSQDADGAWQGRVQYRPDEPTRMIATFPADGIGAV